MAHISSSELLWHRWLRNAGRSPSGPAVIHWRAGEEPTRITWRDLVAGAAGYSSRLAEAGVSPGDVCGVILRHHAEFYALYMGISALGAIPAVLAYPNPRIHPDKFVSGLRGMAQRSGLDWLLTEHDLEPTVKALVEGADSSIRGLVFPLDWGPQNGDASGVMLHASPDSPCLLQHSSGTTGLQKAVVLSHRAVLAHVDTYASAIGLCNSDKVASWLPLYHDMGLIAALQLPLAFGIPLIQIDPFEWVLAPELLLQAISQERATLTWLPNFGYNLLADRARDDELEGVSLASARMLVNCGEPVRAESHQRFLNRFAPFGLRPQALAACYAMAETTFAATQTAPGTRARELLVNRDALSRGRIVPTVDLSAGRWCVSSGAPILGCEICVADDAGYHLPPGQVGELWIRSDSLFDGYRNASVQTGAALVDGWYRSGDLGFVWDGEVYVSGRIKDLIIHAGKNLYPEDVEDAVSSVPGVIPGRVVAFGIDDDALGTETVCVLAETEETTAEGLAALKLAIVQGGMGIDVTIGRVKLVPKRWLIKSSSGKLARRANRARLLADELRELS